ncbi:hypothetical protein B0H17DRAFT_1135112 [Mycena rosella]|uniref:Uncharacterized protein n=1 Tax=Mycena rosella TaxID=1033263 RepID=A0AAD7DEC4_MYCRO|nr:hypothetical protein B0H17DRAFT_1135112 [Mycena rosella]
MSARSWKVNEKEGGKESAPGLDEHGERGVERDVQREDVERGEDIRLPQQQHRQHAARPHRRRRAEHPRHREAADPEEPQRAQDHAEERGVWEDTRREQAVQHALCEQFVELGGWGDWRGGAAVEGIRDCADGSRDAGVHAAGAAGGHRRVDKAREVEEWICSWLKSKEKVSVDMPGGCPP